jgi:formyltetrahydrofolate synthetase
MHGGAANVSAGKPADPRLKLEDPEGVRRGCANLAQHLAIVHEYRVPAVVAINAFPDDHQSEIDVIRSEALAAGAREAVVSRHFMAGGQGAEELARAVWGAAAEGAPGFRFLNEDGASLTERIESIAMRIYGADGIALSGEAGKSLQTVERLGYGNLPVCMAKTQSSLSHDPSLKGRPTGYLVPIRDARLFAGAGFVTAYCGDMRTMPGLPVHPKGEGVDIDADGRIVGLF